MPSRRRETPISARRWLRWLVLRFAFIWQSRGNCGLFHSFPRSEPRVCASPLERGGFEPPVPRGSYGRNSARVWRTIRPDKRHPCRREFVRLGFGSASALSGSLRLPRLNADARRRRTSDQSFGFKSERLYDIAGRNFSPASFLQPRQTAAVRAMENSVGARSAHHPPRGDLTT